MSEAKSALKTTAIVLLTIWVLNQTSLTRPLVAKALSGQ